MEEIAIHHFVHHSIELGGSTMLAIVLILGVIALCVLYPMVMSYRVLPSEPAEEPFMGFTQR